MYLLIFIIDSIVSFIKVECDPKPKRKYKVFYISLHIELYKNEKQKNRIKFKLRHSRIHIFIHIVDMVTFFYN